MKKARLLMALLLVAVFTLAFVACGESAEPQNSSAEEKPVPSESVDPTPSEGTDEPVPSEGTDDPEPTEHVHAYGEWIAEVAATCTEAGVKAHYHCAECGKDFDENYVEIDTAVAAKGHTEEVVKGKAATCTETGLTDGKKCSVCGTVTEEQQTIAALPHTEEVVKGKAATCTETGLTDGKKCSVCGEVLTKQTEIAKKDHSYGTLIAEKPATYDADGVAAHYHCSVCNKDFDEQHKELKTLVIAKKVCDHKDTEVKNEVRMTDSADGYTGDTYCKACGKKLADGKAVSYQDFLSNVHAFTLDCINENNIIADVSKLSDNDMFDVLTIYTYTIFSEDGFKRVHIFQDPNGNEIGTRYEYTEMNGETWEAIDKIAMELKNNGGYPWVNGYDILTFSASADEINDLCKSLFGRTIDCTKVNYETKDVGYGNDKYYYDATRKAIINVETRIGGIGDFGDYWTTKLVSIDEKTQTGTVKVEWVEVDFDENYFPIETPHDKGTLTVKLAPKAGGWTISGIIADNRTK